MRIGYWLAGLAAVALMAGCTGTGAATSNQSRQAEVAERGQSVMPFDLDRTTHRFTTTDDGLIEVITADQPGDAGQTTLIRTHLRQEAQRFQAGDYTDPARLHGSQMPGLADLSAGAARIQITYAEVPDGATIQFRTSDPALVDALHAWGAAQLTDHGPHATG